MKHFYFIFFALMGITLLSKGQVTDSLKTQVETPEQPPLQHKENENLVFEFVEVMPEYPGGMNELRKEVQRNYRIPTDYKRSGEKGGTITTRFVVEKDGSIGEVKILKSFEYPSCDSAAIASILSVQHKFSPALHNGEPVRVWYTLPIVIKIINKVEISKADKFLKKYFPKSKFQWQFEHKGFKYFVYSKKLKTKKDVLVIEKSLFTEIMTNRASGKIELVRKGKDRRVLIVNQTLLPDIKK